MTKAKPDWTKEWAKSNGFSENDYSELTPYYIDPTQQDNRDQLRQSFKISLVKVKEVGEYWIGWSYEMNVKRRLIPGNIAMSWVSPKWLLEG